MPTQSASTPAVSGSAADAARTDSASSAVDATSSRRVVFVAGSGRSGTSTLAGILRELGIRVPQPEVDADATNPRGFAEPQWLVDFHTELLRRSGAQVSDARPRAWFEASRPTMREGVRQRATEWLDKELAEANEVVLKDPRLAWFLGLWRVAAIRAGATPCFATMLRPPTEVVGSKQKYYNRRMGDAHGTAAWINMMLHTERATRGSPRVFLHYHDLLDDWTSSMVRTGEALDLVKVQKASADGMRRVHNFIEPSLHRVRLTWDDLEVPPRLRELATATWDQLSQLADPDGECDRVHAELDALRESYLTYYEETEGVVYSSLLAARRTGDGQPKPTPAPPPMPDPPSGRLARLVDRIPHDQRARIPAPLRRGARRVLAHRRGDA